MFSKLICSTSAIAAQKSLLGEIQFEGANFGQHFQTQFLGIHFVKLHPGRRTSLPHAESDEEEFLYVVQGRAHAWINGWIYEIGPGDAVGFPSGTGIVHTVINNFKEPCELVVIGERTKPHNKCAFPLHPNRKSDLGTEHWDAWPRQEFGPNTGEVGDLSGLKSDRPSCIVNVSQIERKGGFSYTGSTETFGGYSRFTDPLGLKVLGISHEIVNGKTRTSWPHSHLKEEEAAFILEGNPTVWLNGFLYPAKPGDCIHFPHATNIAHTLQNDTPDAIAYISVGLTDEACKNDKVYYPLHPDRNEECRKKGFLWEDRPQAEFKS